MDGRILGRHEGIHRFTVGQRQGLGIPFSEPLYVVAIDPDNREVVVGPRAALDTRKFLAEGWNWHFPEGERPAAAQVQVRYHQAPGEARFVEVGEGLMIEWSDRPRQVTPGQAAVAYQGDTVVGGGWILRGLA